MYARSICICIFRLLTRAVKKNQVMNVIIIYIYTYIHTYIHNVAIIITMYQLTHLILFYPSLCLRASLQKKGVDSTYLPTYLPTPISLSTTYLLCVYLPTYLPILCFLPPYVSLSLPPSPSLLLHHHQRSHIYLSI